MTDTTSKEASARLDKFHQELQELNGKVLAMAELAQQAVSQSLTALWQRHPELARQVIAGDRAINELEEEIDIAVVRVIALYQPVAVDLRRLMAIDHIIVELERLGDLAVNIAEETLELAALPRREFHPALPRMAQAAQTMIRQSLTAFTQQDVSLARQVCRADDEVDDLDRRIIKELLADMESSPEAVAFGQSQITIVRSLERAADHATNIAEQVVFMVEGESVRHRCQD